jgi:hypothetical protein
MRGERVLTLLLEPGDVIHLCHQHDCGCSACLSHWEIDAVVTENPAVVCDRVAVKWAHTARQLLGGPATTGISVFCPDEQVLRIGRLPVGHRRQ